MRRALVALVALAAAASTANGGLEQGAEPVAVTIAVRLDAGGRGTFAMTGGLADDGRVMAKRSVVGGRLHATQTLNGRRGRLVLTSSRACARTAGTWKVAAGAGAYAGASGGGATIERTSCARPWKPSSSVLRGTVAVPPPPLATAGPYRGWTTQDKEISFTVAPDGRSLTDVLLGGYSVDCVRSDGRRFPSVSQIDAKVKGPVAIADDRAFSFGTFAKVQGRFTQARAEGTIEIAQRTGPDPQGVTTTCAASIPWTASTPAPPQWRALSGTYCGISGQSQGVCFDVAEDGRSFRNLRLGTVVLCGTRPPWEPQFVFTITGDVVVPLRSDLSFRASFTQPLETDGSASAFLSGTFDRTGQMTGGLSLDQPTFTRDGTRYACRRSSAGFTANLQR